MDQQLVDKIAIVTGAASGLGRATALAFAKAGVLQCLLDVNENGLRETARLVEQQGGRSVSAITDVGSQSACAAAVAQTVEAFGAVHMLCNVAGILAFGPASQISSEQWQRVISVNLNGPFFMSQAAMPHLLAADGAIVNVASSAAFQGQAYTAAYAASKAALVSMTKSLAMEYVNQSIRINAVAPGGMDTPMAGDLAAPSGVDMSLVQRYMPTRGKLPPEDIADMIVYLASPRAKSIHGAVVNIDGGMTAG